VSLLEDARRASSYTIIIDSRIYVENGISRHIAHILRDKHRVRAINAACETADRSVDYVTSS